jgi:hypothetical protein
MAIGGRSTSSSLLNNMNKVYISIPTKTGQVYFELMIRLLGWSHQSAIPVVINFEPFKAPIDHCRNTIVKKFLATDCTHLLMIDDDIVPPAATLERLLFHDKNIVGAVCPIIGPDKNGKLITGYNAYKADSNDKLMQHLCHNNSSLEEVDAIGTGCIMIKRSVFESMQNTAPFLTKYDKKTGIKTMGEDIYFCHLANDMDIEIYADYKLKCKHIKACNLLEI